jgi:prepilin-type N-terminal cleavage/methylation domain-containing protein
MLIITKKIKKTLNFYQGFSLVELMVAISMIAIVFTSLISLVNTVLANLSYSHNYLVASYLAQEGIELITQKRNENFKNGLAFDAGIIANCLEIDYKSVLRSCSGESNNFLKYSENNGFQYNGGNDTVFKRTIKTGKVNANEIRVQSIVKWKTRNQDFEIVVEDHLYNWFEGKF